MKVLIWLSCFFVTALIQNLFGMKLGGIPAAMFFGATYSIAKNFASRYDQRKNKTSQKYAEATKGLKKGFVWYGASILYVILGTIFLSADPVSFDFVTQIAIAVVCISLALFASFLINSIADVNLEGQGEESSAAIEYNNKNCFCRKCGTHLEDDSRFCRKCGTEIKEEQQ